MLTLRPALGSPQGFSDHVLARDVAAQHAAASAFTMHAPSFYDAFPYHLVLDGEGRVLQVGGGEFFGAGMGVDRVGRGRRGALQVFPGHWQCTTCTLLPM